MPAYATLWSLPNCVHVSEVQTKKSKFLVLCLSIFVVRSVVLYVLYCCFWYSMTCFIFCFFCWCSWGKLFLKNTVSMPSWCQLIICFVFIPTLWSLPNYVHISEVQTKQSVLLVLCFVVLYVLYCCFWRVFARWNQQGCHLDWRKQPVTASQQHVVLKKNMDNIEIQKSVQKKLQLWHLLYCANFECFQKLRCQNFSCSKVKSTNHIVNNILRDGFYSARR